MSTTLDVDPRFERAFPLCCERIGCKPADLLGVMMSESGVKPNAHNRNGGASGLIQFMPDTLRGLGWNRTPQEFRMLSASAQLPWVAAYFSPWKKTGAPFDSAGRVYQAVFLPGTLAKVKAPSGVLAAKAGVLGWAYESNAVFDANGDGRITLGELTASVKRNAKGPRWRELATRLGLEVPALEDIDGDGIFEVVTMFEVQHALTVLGFEPGATDGIVGPKTRAAIRAFQAKSGTLRDDGIAGPRTRAELARRVSSGTPTLPELAHVEEDDEPLGD